MKTERVTLLTSPEFKAFLTAQARQEGVSVAELVRSRCEPQEGEEDTSLRALALELRKSVKQAQQSLRSGLAEAEDTLRSLRKARNQPSVPNSDARAVDGKKTMGPA